MFKDRKILVGLIFVVYSMLLVKWIMCVEREKGVGVRKKKNGRSDNNRNFIFEMYRY